MEIDYDYLRTRSAIGFRASRELFSNYLLVIRVVIYRYNKLFRRPYVLWCGQVPCELLSLCRPLSDWSQSRLRRKKFPWVFPGFSRTI